MIESERRCEPIIVRIVSTVFHERGCRMVSSSACEAVLSNLRMNDSANTFFGLLPGLLLGASFRGKVIDTAFAMSVNTEVFVVGPKDSSSISLV